MYHSENSEADTLMQEVYKNGTITMKFILSYYWIDHIEFIEYSD